MAKKRSRNQRRKRVHRRVRRKVQGTAQRPRLCVFRSLKHTSSQLVDDLEGKTLAAVSTLKLDGKREKNGGNVESAKRVGKAIATAASAQGVKRVVFDRGGYLYHGRVRAVAEAAREGGLEF